nr:Rho termination factor N-terminal domain-containing protein [uncultured Blautia sp.]
MLIRNIKSGLVQECRNADVIKVCKKDTEHFEVFKSKPEVKLEVLNEEEPVKTIEDMTLPELKALAKEKGIKGAGSLNKEELLAVLKDVI